MNYSFGKELLHFAHSVDNLDKWNMDEIKKLLFRFFKDKVGIATVELCTRTTINNDIGLEYIWYSNNDMPEKHSIKRETGEYYGQTSYAFEKDVPLWIVEKKKNNLNSPEAIYLDCWSKSEGLPSFNPYSGNREIKTSIIIPLEWKRRVEGVLNLESELYLEFYLPMAEELERIKRAIEILLEVERSTKERKENTAKAIDTLRASAENSPSIQVPKIFVAFSNNNDSDVIGYIENVLEKFFKEEQIIFWNKVNRAGNINQQILEAIRNCTFGLCYFSEKKEGEFTDNPNVLFEAGMLHALTNDPAGQPKNWIPIREESQEIPFDFASERILVVPRNGDAVSENQFKQRLKNMLSDLVPLRELPKDDDQ